MSIKTERFLKYCSSYLLMYYVITTLFVFSPLYRNMQYEKKCRFLKVILMKNDVINSTLALVTLNEEV